MAFLIDHRRSAGNHLQRFSPSQRERNGALSFAVLASYQMTWNYLNTSMTRSSILLRCLQCLMGHVSYKCPPPLPSFNTECITHSVMCSCRTVLRKRSFWAVSRSMKRKKRILFWMKCSLTLIFVDLSAGQFSPRVQTMTETLVWKELIELTHNLVFLPSEDVLFMSLSKIKQHTTFSTARDDYSYGYV